MVCAPVIEPASGALQAVHSATKAHCLQPVGVSSRHHASSKWQDVDANLGVYILLVPGSKTFSPAMYKPEPSLFNAVHSGTSAQFCPEAKLENKLVDIKRSNQARFFGIFLAPTKSKITKNLLHIIILFQSCSCINGFWRHDNINSYIVKAQMLSFLNYFLQKSIFKTLKVYLNLLRGLKKSSLYDLLIPS